MSDKKNTFNSTTKISQESEKEKKNAQSVEGQTERKLSLLGIVGVAQAYLSVDLVLDTKRELFGTRRKLNDLESWELGKLINVLRKKYVEKKANKST